MHPILNKKMLMDSSSFFQNIFRGIKNKLKTLFANPYGKINLNWFKIKYYKHLPPGKIKKHILFGKPIYFSDSVQLVSGLKEIFIEEAYRQQLQEKPYIIDCGANIGLSIIYIKKHYPNAEIIAFEPDETNFHLLSRNIESFEYSNVSLHKEAVWIDHTTLQFSSKGSMSSKIVETETIDSIPVKAIRLKDFLTKKVDFLKMDIEGSEYCVIKDIADKLHLVKNLFIEYHGTFEQNSELAELIDIVKESGFNFYIREAASLFDYPFWRVKKESAIYDLQLNIFCFRL